MGKIFFLLKSICVTVYGQKKYSSGKILLKKLKKDSGQKSFGQNIAFGQKIRKTLTLYQICAWSSIIILDYACKRHHLAYSAAHYHNKSSCNISAPLKIFREVKKSEKKHKLCLIMHATDIDFID